MLCDEFHRNRLITDCSLRRYETCKVGRIWTQCNVDSGDAAKTDVTPAILSRDFVAQLYRATKSQVWHGMSRNYLKVAQLFFRLSATLYSVQIRHENAVNADWSILVYATKLQCATRHVTLAILSRDKVAPQNHAIKLQL